MSGFPRGGRLEKIIARMDSRVQMDLLLCLTATGHINRLAVQLVGPGMTSMHLCASSQYARRDVLSDHPSPGGRTRMVPALGECRLDLVGTALHPPRPGPLRLLDAHDHRRRGLRLLRAQRPAHAPEVMRTTDAMAQSSR